MNNEKKITYFLLAIEPLTFKFSFKELLISRKIIIKNNIINIIFSIKSVCRFFSFKLIKLLSINVRKVKNPKDRVIKKSIVINIFLFRKDIIG